jgi:hypothetical protein
MAETTSSTAGTSSASPPAKKGSPLRLLILLGVLGVLFVGLMVDMFVMRDAVNAAAARLNDAHVKINAKGINPGDEAVFLTKSDIQDTIGFAPTYSEVQNDQLVEYYRWWGPIPLKRRYIVVFYDDQEGTKYQKYEVANDGGDEPTQPTDDVAVPPADPNQPTGPTAVPKGAIITGPKPEEIGDPPPGAAEPAPSSAAEEPAPAPAEPTDGSDDTA